MAIKSKIKTSLLQFMLEDPILSTIHVDLINWFKRFIGQWDENDRNGSEPCAPSKESQKQVYCISWNNSPSLELSPPSNNRPPLMEMFKIIASVEKSPPPHPSRHLLLFYPLPVKLTWNLIQQNRSVTIQALKINHVKEPNLEHFKSPCSVYLMW